MESREISPGPSVNSVQWVVPRGVTEHWDNRVHCGCELMNGGVKEYGANVCSTVEACQGRCKRVALDRSSDNKKMSSDTEPGERLITLEQFSQPATKRSSGHCVDKNANGVDAMDAVKSETNPHGIPIDRGWAWVVVAACFGMHVLVVGGIKSFGVLFVELQDKYHVQAQELGIIQGMAFTLMMALGLPANMLAQRFNSRKVVFMGGILTALGFILTAYMPQFFLLYITYGLIT
ncbi:hypothetical protein Btru_039435, partial [Bulinus truncatus]